MENFSALEKPHVNPHFQLKLPAIDDCCPTYGFTAAGTTVTRSNARHVKVPPEDQGV